MPIVRLARAEPIVRLARADRKQAELIFVTEVRPCARRWPILLHIFVNILQVFSFVFGGNACVSL